MAKVDVLGMAFDKDTMSGFVTRIQQAFRQGRGQFVVTANPEIVMYARSHPEFARLVAERADLVTADGIGVVKGAAMLGTPLPERVTGYDLMHELLAWASEEHLRVALVGAKQAVNDAAVAAVQAQYPGVTIAMARDGYFDLTDKSVVDAVAAAQPDLVFAALGFPKQEMFLDQLQAQLPKAVMMGVGGSFDVLSGTVKRAPKWMQRIHLEWFYRLVKEPSRIGRMMVLPQFIMAVKQSKRKEKN